MFRVEIRETPRSLEAVIDGRVLRVDVCRLRRGRFSVLIGGNSFEVTLREDSGGRWVHVDGQEIPVEVRDPRRLRRRPGGSGPMGPDHPGEQTLRATMPGRVVTVLAPAGERVRAGQGVIVVEAMKMENELRAPKEGLVKEVLVAAGQAVESGQPLVVIA